MKFFIRFVFSIFLFGYFTLSIAEVSIDAQIQEIKQAPPAQRAQLMNELKIRLSNMNQQDRSDAISQMQQQNRVHAAQADNMKQMQSMERRNQREAGTQYIQNQMGTHSEGTTNTPTPDSGSGMKFMRY